MLLILSGLIWCFYILYGTVVLGHLPHIDDPSLVTANSFEKQLLIGALFGMLLGFIIWSVLVVSNTIFKWYKVKMSIHIVVLFIIAIDLTILLSPCFDWIIA